MFFPEEVGPANNSSSSNPFQSLSGWAFCPFDNHNGSLSLPRPQTETRLPFARSLFANHRHPKGRLQNRRGGIVAPLLLWPPLEVVDVDADAVVDFSRLHLQTPTWAGVNQLFSLMENGSRRRLEQRERERRTGITLSIRAWLGLRIVGVLLLHAESWHNMHQLESPRPCQWK